MKNKLLKLILFSLVFLHSNAQDFPRHAITVKVVGINYRAPQNDNKNIFQNLKPAFELGYGYNINRHISMDIPFRFGVVDFPVYDEISKKVSRYDDGKLYTGLDALIHFHWWSNHLISPFLYAGIGSVLQDGTDFYAQSPLGLGFNIKLGAQNNLSLQSDYRLAFKNGYNNWQHAVGFRMGLGNTVNDHDKDGFPDTMDSCPDLFGTVMGCPDSDGDGTADKDDHCINLSGVPENMGCPADADKDGVYDVDDQCPMMAGSVKGCPDKDKDGIADKEDQCPDKPGPSSTMGCPDKDKDGFADKVDQCPELAGKFEGCPDSDGDGLADHLDQCPLQYGSAANKGCPELKKEDKKTLELAIKSVQFETKSANIAKHSYAILDDIQLILEKYPEMNLYIEGHTDNVGDDVKNMLLSDQRAKACAAYLVKKGIKESRLNSKGFGASRPVGDNKTTEGRKMNRRTEFVPIWR